MNEIIVPMNVKRCAHCGGDANIEMVSSMYRFKCPQCEASTKLCVTPYEALLKWNTRYERTCEVVRRERDEYGEFAEYSCGHVNLWQSWSDPKFCCWCGAKVVE